MKYWRRYPTVRAGLHTSDEILYRADTWRPCGVCGERTDWVDVELEVSVCSEECRYDLVTAKRKVGQVEPRPASPRPGRLVIVHRDRRDVYERLCRRYEGIATVVEDRRRGERRGRDWVERQGLAERRRQERRRPLGPEEQRTWSEGGYVLVATTAVPPIRS